MTHSSAAAAAASRRRDQIQSLQPAAAAAAAVLATVAAAAAAAAVAAPARASTAVSCRLELIHTTRPGSELRILGATHSHTLARSRRVEFGPL